MNDINDMILYDKIVNATTINVFSFSKNGKIIISPFNKNNIRDKFLFEIAKNVYTLFRNSNREIYLDMKLIPYLLFKIKNRKYKFHRYTKNLDITNNEIINPLLLLDYVCKEFGVTNNIIIDIYNKYYKN